MPKWVDAIQVKSDVPCETLVEYVFAEMPTCPVRELRELLSLFPADMPVACGPRHVPPDREAETRWPVLLFVGLIKATDADGIEGLILESE